LMMVVLATVFFLLFLSGAFHLLQAAWYLREGTNRNSFLTKAMIGIGLMGIALLVPYMVMFYMGLNGANA
jgi:hypothetical protein